MAGTKPKGHWPAGRPRHPIPDDWPRLQAALHEAASRRMGRLVAVKSGVHRDTLRRWASGVDRPHPIRVGPLIAALYAARLYHARPGRNQGRNFPG